jgi:hypothetical protein
MLCGAAIEIGDERKRRSRLQPWVRFSLGPSEDSLTAGLARLATLVERQRAALDPWHALPHRFKKPIIGFVSRRT